MPAAWDWLRPIVSHKMSAKTGCASAMLAPDCTLIIPVPRSDPPRIVLHLHTHCLAAKSLFLRGLFSGVSPRDLSPCIPRSGLPCLLQSPTSHPVVFLPVPDPSSIQPLFHWMYSGCTDHLDHALHHGHVQWQGLARNVEYLGLPTDIKVFLGRWYRDRFLPCTDEPDNSDGSDMDSEEYYSPSQNTDDKLQSDDEADRGRSRDVKPLVQLCAQLRLCTT